MKIDKEKLRDFRLEKQSPPAVNLLTRPYWFKIHIYFDIVSWAEYVVLVYDAIDSSQIPVVRVQSESLFNRFPLEHVESRDTFKSSVQAIVENGYGMIVLLPNDGRGAGFGAHAMDKMLCEAQLSSSTDESYAMLGVEYDSRDYSAGFALLKHHLKTDEIVMVMNNANSLVRKTEYTQALSKNGINVTRWIFLDSAPDELNG